MIRFALRPKRLALEVQRAAGAECSRPLFCEPPPGSLWHSLLYGTPWTRALGQTNALVAATQEATRRC